MQLIGIILAVLLAVTMLPAAGFQSAYADEPTARPATTGGDVTLEGAAETAPVATHRDDGTLAADGLVYAATDGGLALVGFDGLPEGEDAAKDITVPAAVSVDGADTPVVAVDIAEGQVAESVVALTLPQSINNVNTATLAVAFPNLIAIEIATLKASAPVAAGAAAIRAAYSSFGGILYKNAWVATDGDASQTTLAKELVWAPPATVVARIPVECTSIAASAFADVRDLKTVVCFGVMADIAQTQKAEDGTVTPGAFTDEQIQTVNVIVPQTGTVVPDGDHVSASVAVTDHSTMDIKREAWWKSGFASDRITLGEVYGSTTNTLPVNEEGVLEISEAEVAYAPETTQNSSSRKAGIEPPESAIPTPVPDDDSIDPSESGLVFTHLADMTLSVSWKGDPTATPAHLDIPAYATINGVTYPVTEIAPHAFEGAVFLTSITIPETIKTIDKAAFKECANLKELKYFSTLEVPTDSVFQDASVPEVVPLADPSIESVSVEVSKNDKNNALSMNALTATDDVLGIENEIDGRFDGESVPHLNDGLIPYGTTNKTMTLFVSPALSYQLTIGASENLTFAVQKSNLAVVTYTGACSEIGWSVAVFENQFEIYARDLYGASCARLYLRPPAGWTAMSAQIANTSLAQEPSDYAEAAYLNLARSEVKGSNPILTTGSFAGTGSAVTAARSDHNHDAAYPKLSDFNSLKTTVGTKLDSSAVSNYNTNAKLDAKFDTKVDASDFGTISYSGVDGGDMSVFPTSYRKGGTPAIPEPEKDGWEFTGWSWARGSASGDSSNIANAFSDAGTVTLTANWKENAAESNCFFASDALDYTTGGAWESVIAVRLTGDASKTSVSGITFAANDTTGLLKKKQDGSLPDVTFAVGASRDALSTTVGFGASPTGSIGLADVEGGKGVWVKITIPAGGVDADRVVGSLTASDYIASLARLSFASIA